MVGVGNSCLTFNSRARNLPNNSTTHQIMYTRQTEKLVKPYELSELCSDLGGEVPATCYCIECLQHISDRCSVVHKTTDATKSHGIVQDIDKTEGKHINFKKWLDYFGHDILPRRMCCILL